MAEMASEHRRRVEIVEVIRRHKAIGDLEYLLHHIRFGDAFPADVAPYGRLRLFDLPSELRLREFPLR